MASLEGPGDAHGIDEEGRGPRIRPGGLGKDDRGEGAGGNRLARSGIEDMGWPILRTTPRGADGQGLVPQFHDDPGCGIRGMGGRGVGRKRHAP